jgi:hypothetical protein
VNSELSKGSHPGASALRKTRFTENPENKGNFTQLLCAIPNGSISFIETMVPPQYRKLLGIHSKCRDNNGLM